MEGIHAVIHLGANAQKVVTDVMSRELKVRVRVGVRVCVWGGVYGGLV